MRKKILSCCLFGAPAGLSVQILFTLWGSYLRGDGKYHFTSGHLVFVYGSELNAVTATCVGAMLIGMIWAAATLIWRETDWNLLQQTLVHIFACLIPSLGIAYVMRFMPWSLDGLCQYLVIFGVLYVLNWGVQYQMMRKRVRELNTGLKELPGE